MVCGKQCACSFGPNLTWGCGSYSVGLPSRFLPFPLTSVNIHSPQVSSRSQGLTCDLYLVNQGIPISLALVICSGILMWSTWPIRVFPLDFLLLMAARQSFMLGSQCWKHVAPGCQNVFPPYGGSPFIREEEAQKQRARRWQESSPRSRLASWIQLCGVLAIPASTHPSQLYEWAHSIYDGASYCRDFVTCNQESWPV